MAITKEFTVLMEDRPSMRGTVCQALADGEVNMLALQSLPNRGRFVIRLIVDKPDIARTVLNSGLEPGTNAPLVFFSVAEVDKAASILEQLSVAAGKR